MRAGIIFAAFQAGYLVTIVPMGMAADRYSARWTIAGGAVGTGVFSLLFALVAEGFLVGTALRFASGLFMAGVYVPGMRFLSDWYPTDDRGTAIGIYVGTFSLSSGLSFFVSSAIAEAVDWQTAIIVTSVGAIIAGPMVFALARDHPEASRPEQALDLSVLKNRDYLLAVGIYSGHNWELFGMRNWIQAFLVTVPAVAAAGGTAVAGTLVGLTMVLRTIAIAPRMPMTTAPSSRASQRRRSVSCVEGDVCDARVRAQNALSSSDANPLAYSTSPARGTVAPHESVNREPANIDPWLKTSIVARARRVSLTARTSTVRRSAWNAVASTTNRTASETGIAPKKMSAANTAPTTKANPPETMRVRRNFLPVSRGSVVLISINSEISARAPPPMARST